MEQLKKIENAKPRGKVGAKKNNLKKFNAMGNSIFAEIFGSVSSSSSVGTREKSVYKRSIYDNLLQSDRKIFRSKARKILDGFLGKYLSNKNNPAALQELAKEWNAYACKVYENTKIIYAGSDESQAKRCNEFVTAMENATTASAKSKNR